MGVAFIPVDAVENYIGKKNVIFVDVREKEEFEEGHIEGAIHIPFDELEERATEINRNSFVILYCHRGNQSLQATRILSGMGYRTASLAGGYEAMIKKK